MKKLLILLPVVALLVLVGFHHKSRLRAAWQDGYIKGANEALETILAQAASSKSNATDVSLMDRGLHERLRDGLTHNPYQ